MKFDKETYSMKELEDHSLAEELCREARRITSGRSNYGQFTKSGYEIGSDAYEEAEELLREERSANVKDIKAILRSKLESGWKSSNFSF
ncbi:MAG: hypothetical protein ABEJ99_01040 [Candidatus Nanohaloarchaea archaeon]